MTEIRADQWPTNGEFDRLRIPERDTPDRLTTLRAEVEALLDQAWADHARPLQS